MRKRGLVKSWLAGTGAALLSLGSASPAAAVNLNLTPSLAVHGVYDSNLFSRSADELSDYYLRVVPALNLSLQLPATTIDLNGSFEVERYARHEELNTANAVVNVGLNASKPIQVSPRFTVAPTVRYLETKDTFRNTQLTASPIAGLPPSDTLVIGRIRSREMAASLQMTYLLSANVDFGLGGAYDRRDFIDKRPDLVDSDVSSANTAISYRITPRFASGPFVTASRTRYRDGRRSEIYGGGVSLTYLPGPQYTVTAHAGVDYLKDTAPGGGILDKSWVPAADITGRYVRGDFTGSLGLSYTPAGGGWSGITTKRGSVIATAGSRFTDRWDWSLSTIYQTNVSASGIESGDYSTFEFDAGTGYLVARWARLKVSGTIFRQWSRPPFGIDISRETVFAGIDLFTTFPLL